MFIAYFFHILSSKKMTCLFVKSINFAKKKIGETDKNI